LYTQTYQNNNSKTLDVDFYFPIPPDASFHSFEAIFGDEKVKGVIKEKQAAQEEYK